MMVTEEATRLAYLKAMGIDVWLPRAADPEAASAQAENGETKYGAAAGTSPVADDWEELRRQVSECTRCVLHQSRTQTVFGVGDKNARLMVIGEAPGAEEDRRGEPFVGRAGKLLDEMLRSLGFGREDVFIANILKCRPPGNRDPRPEESAECRNYLRQQIEFVRPGVILAVGRVAAQNLLQSDEPLGRLRTREHRYPEGEVPVVVTYHPAYLLRSPSQKRKVWLDLCRARERLEETAP